MSSMFDNINYDTDLYTNIAALSLILHSGNKSEKRLKPEIKEKLAAEYKTGYQLDLTDGTKVEILMDADATDVFYNSKADTISISLMVRDLAKEYQNVNLHLLKHGTCARDRYNRYPGIQHYTREDWRVLRKIPDISDKAYDFINLIIIDFKEEN